MKQLIRGILISTIIQAVYERAYERDSHKHANTARAYMSVLMRGILISTLTQAYMSVLMRGILISTLTQAYMHERAYMRGILISTIIQAVYERAYERDSHKHANTSIYERAYERDSHKHDHAYKQYMSVRAYKLEGFS